MIAIVFAVDAALGHYELYANLLITYIGLVFATIYVLDGNKAERILAAFLFSLFGGALTLIHVYSDNSVVTYPTIFAVLSLIPAMFLAIAVRIQGKTPDTMKKFIDVYSIFAALIAALIVIIKVLDTMDFNFAIFVLPGFLMVLTAYIQ